MAKINRYDGNVGAFASNQQTGERRVFGATTAIESNELSDQLTPEFLRGWATVSSNEFPPIEWFNALGFTVTQFIAYLHQVGIPEWNSSQEYHKNSIVNYNGDIYVSTTDNNTGVFPDSGGVGWINPRASTLLSHNTLSDAISDESIKDGYSISIKERSIGAGGGAVWDVVLTSGVTPNGINIVQCTGDPTLSLAMRFGSTVALESLGVADGSDATAALEVITPETAVKVINTTSISNITISKSITISRSDLTLDLPYVTWIGDYDLYDGGVSTRQVGVITVTGSRDFDTPLLVNGAISEGDSTYSLSAVTGLEEGGWAVFRDGSKFNYLTRVTKIDGTNVTLDYTSGWDELANIVSVYQATPVENVHVKIKKLIDASGATIDVNQASGVTFLDAFNCSVEILDAESLANPLVLYRRAHSVKAIYLDNRNPRYTDSGRGYTLQHNGALYCFGGVLKGTQVRHVADWTVSAYCHADEIHANDSAQIAVTTHGQYEHDIDVDRIFTSLGCVGTLALANSGVSFGERTKRFSINERCIVNGTFDIQNSEDFQGKGIRVESSDFTRINADCELINCDFQPCTSFRIRSRPDRDQKAVLLSGGKYPDIELQNFSGTLRAVNATMNWFINQDVLTVPMRIKTSNCRHSIGAASTLTVTEDVSLVASFISVPISASSIGAIVDSKKFSVTSVECENTPVISHESANANVFTVNGLYDNNPNALRTTAIIRARNTDGLKANVSGVTSEYDGAGNIVEFDRADNANLILNMNGNYLNGPLKLTGNGSIIKSIVTSNFVEDLTDLPASDANNAIANNIQL